MRAICLQHVPFEGPGVFATSLANRGAALDYRLVPKDGLPPDPGDLLIIVGGPMSVNDSDPWIAKETAFIRTTLQAGKPVIGVCLGSQFMAKALGAIVRLPESFEVFEWHGEVFDLPNDCVPLAGSDIAPLQAFRYGARAYGLLFHLEMEESGVESLCRECAPDLTKARLTMQQVKAAALPHLPQLHQIADRLIDHLLSPQR
jgi:GMP synthase (glutamine-hydrolysing)